VTQTRSFYSGPHAKPLAASLLLPAIHNRSSSAWRSGLTAGLRWAGPDSTVAPTSAATSVTMAPLNSAIGRTLDERCTTPWYDLLIELDLFAGAIYLLDYLFVGMKDRI
jgi:hypothetical protein